MRGQRRARAPWGAESLRGADAVFVGSGAHPRCSRGRRRARRPGPRGAARGRRRRVRPRGRATKRSPALLEECRADPPNPGNRQERLPDEGNARRLAEFLAGDAPTVLYFGKLLYNKGVHVLLEAMRGIDARTLVVGFGDYRHELERHRAAAHAVHRAAGAPAPRAADPAGRRRPSCPRSSPRRSGWSPPRRRRPDARRSSRGTRASRRWREGLEDGVPRGAAPPGELRDRRLARPRRQAARAARAARRPRARRSARPRRRVAVEKWSWAGVAGRLLEPVE